VQILQNTGRMNFVLSTRTCGDGWDASACESVILRFEPRSIRFLELVPLVTGTSLVTTVAMIYREGLDGEVYAAEDTLLRPPVAIKLLLPDLIIGSIDLLRLEREACAASSLSHPNRLTALLSLPRICICRFSGTSEVS